MEKEQATNTTGMTGHWRKILTAGGVIAIIIALSPSEVYKGGTIATETERSYVEQTPTHMPHRYDFTLGLKSSPLLRIYSEGLLKTDKNQQVSYSVTSGYKLEFISWSMLIFILALFMFRAAWSRPARRQTS